MPPIIVLAAGAFTAGAIVHRLIKEYGINAEIGRVETGAPSIRSIRTMSCKKQRALRLAEKS